MCSYRMGSYLAPAGKRLFPGDVRGAIMWHRARGVLEMLWPKVITYK